MIPILTAAGSHPDCRAVLILIVALYPLALPKRPSTTYTQALINDAKRKMPRLREWTEVQLRNFLIDEESIGVACEKFRSNAGNGWTFPPLAEARDAWARRYGPVRWDNPAEHWGEKVKPVVEGGVKRGEEGVESGGCGPPLILNPGETY